jgi:hypothetical protein
MNSLLTEILSLIAGVITGLVFERRATREVRKYNDELQRQVSVLKTSVMSLGGGPHRVPVGPLAEDLPSLVTKRAIATQGPTGRVDRRALIAHFIEREYAAPEIDAAVSSLCQAGVAREDGMWLQIA